MKFHTQGNLNTHFDQQHSGLMASCPLCEYKAPRLTVQKHIVRKHGIFGSQWDAKKLTFIIHNEKF